MDMKGNEALVLENLDRIATSLEDISRHLQGIEERLDGWSSLDDHYLDVQVRRND